MSNTEFVMVPRAELVRLQENMDPHRGAVAWGIVCDLLAKPAEQQQGEPVALPDRDAMRRAFTACKYHAPHIFEAGWNACLDEIAKLGQLYARPDIAEIQQLELRRDQYKNSYEFYEKENESLRAKLTERDALLREGLEEFKEGNDWIERVISVLSASAEPIPDHSVEVNKKVGREWQVRDCEGRTVSTHASPPDVDSAIDRSLDVVYGCKTKEKVAFAIPSWLELAGYEGSSGLYYSRRAAVANGEQVVDPVYRVKK